MSKVNDIVLWGNITDPFDMDWFIPGLKNKKNLSGFKASFRGYDLILTCDVPGVKVDNVNIEINENGILHMSAIRGEGNSQTVYNAEYVLSKDFDFDTVDAELENGVLTISVKRSEARKPKKIVVKQR